MAFCVKKNVKLNKHLCKYVIGRNYILVTIYSDKFNKQLTLGLVEKKTN